MSVSSRRLTAASAAVILWCVMSLVGPVPIARAAALTNARWTTSATGTGATGVSYTYSFTVATTAPLSSVTMTVPSGTGGSVGLGTVSPANVAGGSVSLAGTTLTYSFASALVTSGTAVSIQINGLTNTTTVGSDTSSLATVNGGSSVDTGTTSAVTFTAGVLTGRGWAASSTTVGATNTSYTFTFTTATTSVTITSITMTVPPGTTGTPTLGAVTPSGLGGTVSLSGTTLTYSGISLLLLVHTAFSIQIKGLSNTATAGAYTSEIVTRGALGTLVDSGVTPAVSFTGTLNLTSPSSLTLAATLNGTDQSVTDQVSADQQFTVDDETASGAGWHITVSATTFTTGTFHLPNTGTFVVTGSTSSASATSAPSASCATSCTPPSTTTTYPVAITTATSSPTPATVYDAPAGTGLGPATLGGNTSPHPPRLVDQRPRQCPGRHLYLDRDPKRRVRAISERGPTPKGDHVKPAHAAGRSAPRAAQHLAAAAALLLTAATGANTPARANATQGDGPFSVTPSPTSSGRVRPYFDLTVAPGQQTSDTAILSNTGPETEVLKISVSTGVTATNSGSAYQNPTGTCTGPSCWVTDLPSTVTIAPRERSILRFHVTVPPGTPAAQYLAGITAEPTSPSTATVGSNGQASAKATIINKVTAGVAITVGPLSQMTTALDVSAVSAGWIGTTPRLSIPVSNVGQTFVRATGTVSCATNGRPHNYDVIMSTVLPGDHAVLAVNAPDLTSGSLPCTVRLDDATDHPVTWSGTVNLPPPVAAKLVHTSNGTYTALPDTTAPPWAVALIVIGVLILATLLALLVLRRRQRRT